MGKTMSCSYSYIIGISLASMQHYFIHNIIYYFTINTFYSMKLGKYWNSIETGL